MKTKTSFDSLGLLGLTALSSFTALMISTRWEWSFLMDDVSYLGWMPKISHIFPAFLQEVKSYWLEGRFYPVKYFFNLVKWRYLPLNPDIFHWVNFILFLLPLAIGAGAWLIQQPTFPYRWQAALFWVGLGFLQRPLFSIIIFNSIAEGWVILFLVLGLVGYPQHKILYRLAFLLCALSKEPAIVVFAASSLVYAGMFWRKKLPLPTALGQAALDGLIFIALWTLIHKAHESGNYMASYALFRRDNFVVFGMGLAKCMAGLTPALFILLLQPRGGWSKLFFGMTEAEQLCLVFGLAYLFLLSPVGSAGYLLIPPAFALLYVAGGLSLRVMNENDRPSKVLPLVVASFLFCLGFSIYKFDRVARSINESTVMFKTLLLSAHPRLILINGPEAQALGQTLADHAQTPVAVRYAGSLEETVQIAKRFRGEIFLFELSGYFSRYPEAFIQTVGSAIGGWKGSYERPYCRIFFGNS